jgi:serine/threonine protein kinase/muconolactone delta-isomerase
MGVEFMTKEQPLAWRELPRSQQAEIEDCVAKFEQQWHLRPFPDISAFLPHDPSLVELVRAELQVIDFEFRQRLGLRDSATENSGRVDPGCGKAFRYNQSESGIQENTSSDADSLRLISNYLAPHQKHAGGLGEVWIVHEPSLERSVAIKQLQRRWRHHARARHAFLQEVRITSLLEHPGVAPVHAVGETDDGRPCYSMRYIQGETCEQAIDAYHGGGQRTAAKLRELLGHFVTVCNTIAYAHSRGVLHRDLKPANIMIGPFGQTMVIDWGLAKHFQLSGPDIEDESSGETLSSTSALVTDTAVSVDEATQFDIEFERLQTALGDIVGTPAFMSPEQASGQVEQISIRTDVFGLGAVLFKILYNKPPFTSPETASTLKLASQCEIQYPESPRTSELPRGIVAICAKAMQRLPEQRYDNAASLASDIQNWLAGEPTSAMQQPIFERLIRFAKRRQTLAIVATLSMVALCLTAVGAALGIQKERAEKLLANRTAEVKALAARDIADYLSRIFRTVDPVQFDEPGFMEGDNHDANKTLRLMLDRGADLLVEHLKGQPEEYSELLTSLGKSYRGLADYERAESMLMEALAIRRSRFGDGSPQVLQSQYFLARCAQDRGDYRQAQQQYREIISAGSKIQPPEPLLVADAKYHLAWALFYQPLEIGPLHFDPKVVNESIRLFTEVAATREAQLGPKDRSVGLAYAGLAAARISFTDQKFLASASAAQAMEIFNAAGEKSALGSVMVTYGRAEALRRDGKEKEAEAIYLQVTDLIVQNLGTRHPIYIVHLWNMAGHYRKFGHLVRAEATIDEIRNSIQSLPYLRNSSLHLDGLCQYAEGLATVNVAKAREVAEEITRYSNERPSSSSEFVARAQLILDRLPQDPTVNPSASSLASPRAESVP